MNKLQDSKTNPPPVGIGDVWAYCQPLSRFAMTKSSDVRQYPEIFPQWRPMNRPPQKQ